MITDNPDASSKPSESLKSILKFWTPELSESQIELVVRKAAEAGWEKYTNYTEDGLLVELMTGKEWYDRLHKELSNEALANTIDPRNHAWRVNDVMEAARRASGVSEDEYKHIYKPSPDINQWS